MGHFSLCWDVHPLHSSAKITPLHKDLHIQSTWHGPQELCPGSPRWWRETGTSRGCFFPHTLNTYFRWDKSLLKVDHISHQLKVSSYFQVAKIKMNMCQSTGGSEGIKTDLKTSFFFAGFNAFLHVLVSSELCPRLLQLWPWIKPSTASSLKAWWFPRCSCAAATWS